LKDGIESGLWSVRRSELNLSRVYVAPRNEDEWKLAAIWQKALDIDTIGIEDDFFELGGDSLSATALFAEVDHVFGKSLPLATLLEGATIGFLASLLEQSGDAVWPMLVPIRTDGAKPPFFLVHGALGQSFLTSDFVRYLGSDQPLYALQARGLDGIQAPHSSIPEMADDYLAEIRSVQATGPYFFGGSCSGSVVALEMAQKLCAEGEQVGLLVMIDPDTPLGARGLLQHVLLWFQLSLLRLQLLPLIQPLLPPIDRIRMADRIRSWIQAKEEKRAHAVNPDVRESHVSEEVALKVVLAFRASLIVYQPQPYAGPVLFLSSAERGWKVGHPRKIWRRLIQGDTQQFELGPTHSSLFRENLRLTVERLRLSLEQAMAGGADRSANSRFQGGDTEPQRRSQISNHGEPVPDPKSLTPGPLIQHR
jgi:thioesterase domain-containing protein/acyl carrier protein